MTPTKNKFGARHPFAAIEHRVIDAPAFADLTPSAVKVLLLIARQLSRDNNGRLQATYSYMKRFQVSENTLSRCIAELIAHGFVYRTRSGGYQQGAAQYAVTWLPLTKDTSGLFARGFKSCAWRDWEAPQKKTRPPKLREDSLKNGEWTAPAPPKIEAVSPPNFEDIELLPCSSSEAGLYQAAADWVPAYLARLAARGMEGQHCFHLPASVAAF